MPEEKLDTIIGLLREILCELKHGRDDEPKQVLLKRRQAAKALKMSISSLDRWRMLGCGPRYSKLNGAIVYRVGDIEEFIARNERASTHQG